MRNDSQSAAAPPSIIGTVRTLYSNLVRPHPRRWPTPPKTITDTDDREIHLRPYVDADHDSLRSMYDAFSHADRAQGAPPLGENAIRTWLDTVLAGVSVVATHRDAVVGHVMFVPDGTEQHELAIFVHPDYQRAGIGRELLRTGLGYAASTEVSKVWLSVEARKRRLEKLYCDVGFTLDNPLGPTHRLSQHL